MTGTQILILVAALGVEVGRLLGSIDSWTDAQTTKFVGGAIASLCVVLLGVISKSPSEVRHEQNRKALADYKPRWP